jgi:phospholipid transport system transporter-binding protein
MQLPADATLQKVAELAAALPAALQGSSGEFTVDASGVTDYDTATIALLMQARRAAQAAGRGFSVKGAPAQLQQLAALYGVEELLALKPA